MYAVTGPPIVGAALRYPVGIWKSGGQKTRKTEWRRCGEQGLISSSAVINRAVLVYPRALLPESGSTVVLAKSLQRYLGTAPSQFCCGEGSLGKVAGPTRCGYLESVRLRGSPVSRDLRMIIQERAMDSHSSTGQVKK